VGGKEYVGIAAGQLERAHREEDGGAGEEERVEAVVVAEAEAVVRRS
jgi:hypothetical protein